MPIAFKEWAVTVRALAEGEQLVTLRKGGIREPRQALRARARPLLPVPDVRPPAQRPRARVPPARAAPRARGGRVARRRAARPRADARRRDPAARPRADPRLGRGRRRLDDHRPARASTRCRRSTCGRPTTPRSACAWKRRHPLHVLLLRTYRIPRPVTVSVRDDYGGCRSWLEITRDLPFEGTPVLSDEEFERASRGDRAHRRRRRRPRRARPRARLAPSAARAAPPH